MIGVYYIPPESTTIDTTSGIKASQVRLRIVCQSQDHRGLFGRDRVSILERHWTVREFVCRSQSDVGLIVGSCVDLRTVLVLVVGIGLGGEDHLKTRLGFHFEVKVQSLSSLDLFFRWFSALYFVIFGGDAEINHSMMKTVNIH